MASKARLALPTAERILRHTETLKFPREAKLSLEAKDLIRRLLVRREQRLEHAQIQAHPFFAGVDWSTLRETPAPFTPRVASETDTQNFDEFDGSVRRLESDERGADATAGAGSPSTRDVCLASPRPR